jgi:hypothetical protein
MHQAFEAMIQGAHVRPRPALSFLRSLKAQSNKASACDDPQVDAMLRQRVQALGRQRAKL